MEVYDFHNDLLTATKKGKEILNEYLRMQVHPVLAVFRNGLSKNTIINIIEKHKKEFGNKFCLALEECGYLNENDGELIDYINPLYCTLTWNNENEFGFGCNDEGGLNRKGKNMIKLLNSKKVSIDTAHSNCISFCDIISMSDIVINSHTCIRKLCDNPRNLYDWQLDLLMEKNALIGICAVAHFLKDNKINRKTINDYGGKETLNLKTGCNLNDGITIYDLVTSEDIAIHIDYIVQRYGYKNVCLGTDFFGTNDLPLDFCNYENALNLVEKLFHLGYNEIAINAIMCDNLKNFIHRSKDKDGHFYLQ